MNRRIRRKIQKRANNKIMYHMLKHCDVCMPVGGRWMSTLEAENRYRILTPLERRVFMDEQHRRIHLVDSILDEIKE